VVKGQRVRLHYHHAGAVFITLTFPNVARFIRCSPVETLRCLRANARSPARPRKRGRKRERETEREQRREEPGAGNAPRLSAASLNLHNKMSHGGPTPRVCRALVVIIVAVIVIVVLVAVGRIRARSCR